MNTAAETPRVAVAGCMIAINGRKPTATSIVTPTTT